MPAESYQSSSPSGEKHHWRDTCRTINIQKLAKRDPIEMLNCYDKLSMEWRPYITHTEISLLVLIFSQTIRWGRISYGFSYPMLENGNGKTPGMGRTKDCLIKLLNGLDKRGIISKRPTGQGIAIKVNLAWKPTPETTPTPKRRNKTTPKPMPASTLWANPAGNDEKYPLRGSVETTSDRQRGSVETTSGVVPKLPIIEQVEKNTERKEQAPFTDDARLRGQSVAGLDFSSLVFAPALKRQRPSRSSHPGKKEEPPIAPAPLEPHRHVFRPGAIEKTFRAAFEETFKDRPVIMPAKWTKAELCRVKTSILSNWFLGKCGGSVEGVHDYVEWTVRNWDYLRSTAFAWMRRTPAPDAPEIGFITKRQSDLLAAYNRDLTNEWMRSITDREEQRYQELIHRHGKTPEEARLKIAEDRAEDKLSHRHHEAMTKMSSRVTFANNQVKAMEERIRQIRRTNPHPESETAKRRREEERQARIVEELGPAPVLAPGEVPDFMQFVGVMFEDGK